jgi:hypothetical protein
VVRAESAADEGKAKSRSWLARLFGRGKVRTDLRCVRLVWHIVVCYISCTVKSAATVMRCTVFFFQSCMNKRLRWLAGKAVTYCLKLWPVQLSLPLLGCSKMGAVEAGLAKASERLHG